jgi:hypothetical protein
MSRTKKVFLIAGAALSLGASAMGQSTLDQSRSYSNELLADSAGRTSALAQPARTFTVDVHGYLQFRYVWTHLDDDDLDDDSAVGFQTARTVLSVSGNIINENWGYYVQFGFDRDGGSVNLEDAYGTYKMDNGWNLMWGQFKLPILREELVSDKFQLAADRSATNSVFSQMRSQGVQLGFEGDQVRFMGAFSDGVRTANTDYTSGAEADWALTGRVEFKWAGDWKQARDFTSFQNSDYFGMVGGAVHWQSGGDTVGTFDGDMWMATVDISMEGNGWNVFGAAMYSNVDPDPGSSVKDWGWLVQGGFFVAPQWELFARYDMVIPDDDRVGSDENFSTITIGANHYVVPESHVAKATIQFIYFLDNPSESIVGTNTLIPLLGSNEDNQWSILGQFQLVF